MKLFIRIDQGYCIPRGYRVAWEDFPKYCWVCCPFGLHWIARFFNRLWVWSYRYRRTAWEEKCRDMHREIQQQYTDEILALRKRVAELEDSREIAASWLDRMLKPPKMVNGRPERNDQN